MGYATKRVKVRRHNFLLKCLSCIVLGGANMERVTMWQGGDFKEGSTYAHVMERFRITTPDGDTFESWGTVPPIVAAAKAMGVV